VLGLVEVFGKIIQGQETKEEGRHGKTNWAPIFYPPHIKEVYGPRAKSGISEQNPCGTDFDKGVCSRRHLGGVAKTMWEAGEIPRNAEGMQEKRAKRNPGGQ